MNLSPTHAAAAADNNLLPRRNGNRLISRAIRIFLNTPPHLTTPKYALHVICIMCELYAVRVCASIIINGAYYPPASPHCVYKFVQCRRYDNYICLQRELARNQDHADTSVKKQHMFHQKITRGLNAFNEKLNFN